MGQLIAFGTIAEAASPAKIFYVIVLVIIIFMIWFLTPQDVHYGRSEQIIKERQAVLHAAYKKHPERFKGKMPNAGVLPTAVWINKPAPEKSDPVIH